MSGCGYKQKYNIPTSYTRNTSDSGPGGAWPSASLLMTFSGLSIPSKPSATFLAAVRPRFGTGGRQQRLADRYCAIKAPSPSIGHGWPPGTDASG